VVCLVFAALVGTPGAIARRTDSGAKLRQAKKLLSKLRLVDGHGSGLDADTVQGMQPPVVVDSNGNFVGVLVELVLPDVGWVMRRIGDRPFLFYAASDGLAANPDTPLWFESADCTGQGLFTVYDAQPGLVPPEAIVSADHVYYPVGESAQHTIASSLYVHQTQQECTTGTFVPPDGCCFTLGGQPLTDAYVNAASIDTSSLGLVPPFHLVDLLPVTSSSSTSTTTLP
jgi:hypothetical protein